MNNSVDINMFKISAIRTELLQRRWPRQKWTNPELESYVRSIIEDVKKHGDPTLVRLTEKFDGVKLSVEDLKVRRKEIDTAYKSVKKEWISALSSVKDRIEHLEKQRLERMNFESEDSGVKICFRTHPIRSVGCYVPGGEAAYPSTLVMIATPAKLAGVQRVVACSPPDNEGKVNPLTLVAADLCQIDEVYKVGGAQAIAALAYGTRTMEPVEKIVGPGNRYVTMAKILVSQDVATDAPAGPTEIMVLADDTADPRLIALDLVSQAEHGVDSIPILLTTSEELARRVAKELKEVVPSLGRREAVKALSTHGLIITCRDLDEATDFVNEFAPEHLEVVTEEPTGVAERVKSAGLILLGRYTPVSASDYAFGTNHVLPTAGFGRVFSGLSIYDFVRRVNIVECSLEGLSRLRNNVRALAEAEGLPNHALAVEGRS